MYLKLDTLTPCTESEIRAAFPNTSFPSQFSPPEGYAVLFAAPQPAHDPITQTVRPGTPVLTNKGHYEQTWEVVDLPAEQAAANAEAARKARVPNTLFIRQAKLVLHHAGLLDDVDAAVAAADKATQIEWEYATEVKRDWPTLVAMAAALGMTDAQLDDLFVQGAAL